MYFSKSARTLQPPPQQNFKFPQLIILGAQKSGTTALATYLGQHPRLLHPKRKEVNFFGSGPSYLNGLDWYTRQWPKAKNAIFGRLAFTSRKNEIRFEASPHYLRSREAASRIHDCLPNVKLIVILRDPVERAYSAWQMYRKQLAGNPAFYDDWSRRIDFPDEVAALEPRSAAELNDFELAVRREADCLSRGKSMVWSLLEYGFYGEQIALPAILSQAAVANSPKSRFTRSHRRNAQSRAGIHRIANLELVSDRFIAGAFQRHFWPQVPDRVGAFLRNFYTVSNRQVEEFGFDSP